MSSSGQQVEPIEQGAHGLPQAPSPARDAERGSGVVEDGRAAVAGQRGHVHARAVCGADTPVHPDLALAGIAADADTATEARVYFHTPEWTALLEWLEFHGVNPKLVLAGTRVSRDECNRCIRYVRIVVDEHGCKVIDGEGDQATVRTVAAIEQGEAPPLPYPDVIARWLR